MTIKELIDRSYEQAVASGWGEDKIPFPEAIALIHSEASEALECFRNGEPELWFNVDKSQIDPKTNLPVSKPEGIAAEFADIFIRMGHYIRLYNLPIEEALEAKMQYNALRPHRHGGKKC